MIAEADGSTGATTREYMWMDDLPVGLVQAGNLSMVHTGHLARPIRITDTARSTVWQATWGPWGEPQSISGTLALDMRFPGQLFQIETGLHYNWHRHYDPVTGRYTQPDPLRFVDGPSVYAYAGSSPFMNVDEDGQVIGNLAIGAGLGAAEDLFSQLQENGWRWKCINYWRLGASAALGAIGGKATGAILSRGLKKFLTIGRKGKIGEALSMTYNRLKGGRFLNKRNKAIPGYRTRADSHWEGYYVESKFGDSPLRPLQKQALAALGPSVYRVERWSYEFFSRIGAIPGGLLGGYLGRFVPVPESGSNCGCQ